MTGKRIDIHLNICMQPITELLGDKAIKGKKKVEMISTWLLDESLPVTELINAASKAKGGEKAICIEAIEFTTRQNPAIADKYGFAFVTKQLEDDAPRVKWESARVIGNIAHLFPAKLDKAISRLLTNSENEGTVVRWATACALGEIIKLKSLHNKELLPAIEAICDRETDTGVRKKYTDALKKAKK